MELFKLYFVFDKLNLKNNNPRKCMLEMRPEVSGDYKGYIYCFSLSEANEIQNQLTTILNKKNKRKYFNNSKERMFRIWNCLSTIQKN
jgi:hypothetical protein